MYPHTFAVDRQTRPVTVSSPQHLLRSCTTWRFSGHTQGLRPSCRKAADYIARMLKWQSCRLHDLDELRASRTQDLDEPRAAESGRAKYQSLA